MDVKMLIPRSITVENMAEFQDQSVYETGDAGILLYIKNDTDGYMDVVYASLTSHDRCIFDVYLGEKHHDRVYAVPGMSHSWWLNAGGKLLDHNGLDPGQTLLLKATGRVALRLDWIK